MTTTTTICEAPAKQAKERSPSREDLWRRYKRARLGGAVENELVQQYLPLVKNVVGRMAMTLPPHVDIEDLNSAGLVGLLNAIRNFDPKSGAS
ncbi:MAG: FliA/WhiG family RNA polymerase sigma factor, partial [Verrucomicrobia bacterium]|nr:FliA/WhiG family RNA polymerase sigma factor [Verrucomicrobiota bacterium]